MYGEAGSDTYRANDSGSIMQDTTSDSSGNIFHGGSGADTIRGDNGIDDIQGGSGVDTIYGYGGCDDIKGQEGDDTIHGNRRQCC